MRKEITCYVNTNEEGEEVSVQRVTSDPAFILLRLGPNMMVLNKAELIEAIGAIDFYSVHFDEDAKRAANRAKLEESRVEAAKRQQETKSKTKKTKDEDDEVFLIEHQNRQGPTESELALSKIMEGIASGGTIKE